MKKALALISSLALLASCASAPYADSVSARSLGQKNTAFLVGYQALSGVALQIAHGLNEDLDIGAQMEFGSVFTMAGLQLKYAFINPIADGYAMALTSSVGSSGSDSYYGTLGLGMSYRYKRFEPGLFSRYNYVINREQYDFVIGNKKYDLNSGNFSYFYLNPTIALWITPKMALAINFGVILSAQGTFVDSGSTNGGINYMLTL